MSSASSPQRVTPTTPQHERPANEPQEPEPDGHDPGLPDSAPTVDLSPHLDTTDEPDLAPASNTLNLPGDATTATIASNERLYLGNQPVIDHRLRGRSYPNQRPNHRHQEPTRIRLPAAP